MMILLRMLCGLCQLLLGKMPYPSRTHAGRWRIALLDRYHRPPPPPPEIIATPPPPPHTCVANELPPSPPPFLPPEDVEDEFGW